MPYVLPVLSRPVGKIPTTGINLSDNILTINLKDTILSANTKPARKNVSQPISETTSSTQVDCTANYVSHGNPSLFFCEVEYHLAMYTCCSNVGVMALSRVS
jgi:hypothetical protein